MARPRGFIRHVVASLPLAAALLPAHAQDVTYAEIAPILASRCVMCHTGPNAALGLRLDNLDNLRKGSRKGPVVKAGDPTGSELIRRIRGTSQPRMPMTGQPYLSEKDIALLERWVTAGLKPGEGAPAAATPATLPKPGETVTYTHVAPIFAQRCAKCHAQQGIIGPAPEGYVLTSHASTVSAADRARVVPGNPAASELVRRVRGQARPRMPHDGPPYLSDAEIEVIARWIAQGARNAEGSPTTLPAGAPVRLHGTLSSRWRLDDLPLTVTPSTRIDKSPGPGDYAQVRGRVGQDGAVIAERVRRR
jgi:mono/diheme cytochrome c family protein